MPKEVVLLKLGGSLITDKNKPYTPRLDVLEQLSQEIKVVLDSNPELVLILGHGSGSFGHTTAKKFGTREGVHTKEEWRGFAEVRFHAAELNRHVLHSLIHAGIPAISFPPSSFLVSADRKVRHFNIMAMRKAIEAGILPVVYGDVAFDELLGGTILSTEDVFIFLVEQFSPTRILLAGIESGVWSDFPTRTLLVPEISAEVYESMREGIGGSTSTDVTGGMKAKVEEMLDLIKLKPGLTAQIFSTGKPGQLTRALQGEVVGTLIKP